MTTTAPAVTPLGKAIAERNKKFNQRSILENIETLVIDSIEVSPFGDNTIARVSITNSDNEVVERKFRYNRLTPIEFLEENHLKTMVDVSGTDVSAYILPVTTITGTAKDFFSSPYLYGGTDFDYDDVTVTKTEVVTGVFEIEVTVEAENADWLPGTYNFYVIYRPGHKANLTGNTFNYIANGTTNTETTVPMCYQTFEDQSGLEVTGLAGLAAAAYVMVGVTPTSVPFADIATHLESAYIKVQGDVALVKAQGDTMATPYDLPADKTNLKIGYATDRDNMGDPLDMPPGALVIMDGSTVIYTSTFLHSPQITTGTIGFMAVDLLDLSIDSSHFTLSDNDYLTDVGV